MTQKLINKSTFATLAGVNPSTITRLATTILKSAMVGKRVDSNHPDAIQYLTNQERKSIQSPATGIDPLYETAVAFFNSGGRRSISALQRELKIGYNRAANIVGMIEASGAAPKDAPPPPPVEEKPKVPYKRGYAARNETKKQNRPPITDPEDMLHSIPEDIRAFADMSLRDLVHRFGTDVAFLDWLKATKAIEDINEKRLKNAQTRGELVSRHLMKVGVIEPIDAAHIKLLTDGAKTIARRVTAMTAAGKSVEDCEKFVADQMTSFIRPIKAKVARALKNA